MLDTAPMSKIKAFDLAFVRMTSPDLDRTEEFLTDFGFLRSHRDSRSLYMRGSSSENHLIAVSLGKPRVQGIAFSVIDESILSEAARQIPNASPVETVSEPGGGQRVRLTDPAGFGVELVYRKVSGSHTSPEEFPINTAERKSRRAGIEARPPGGPSHITRFSHFVLVCPELHQVAEWYEKSLGVLCSDVIYRETKDNIVAYFYRVDQGAAYVDHHMINLVGGKTCGINHLAFEVRDLDDVMIGHEWLRRKNYRHMRGPGRHFLGSQIFDYWVDPWSCMFEHITDSDVFNESKPRGMIKSGETESHWGESSFAEFRSQLAPLSD